MKKKKIVLDLLYCIGAVGLMNVVLQFIVYPLINKYIGAEAFGDMLFWLGIVSILAPSFGLAVNNTRLVFPERENTGNLDYIVIVVLFSVISAVIMAVLSRIQNYGLTSGVFLVYILVVSIFRNYSTVEYRLNLNYKKQFIFYSVLSAGYVFGAAFCKYTDVWFGVFVLGETLAVLYVVITGSIYRIKAGMTVYRREISRRCFVLALAYLLTNLMLNLDRLVLKYYVGSGAVSQYYVLSLLGKTVAIIGGPLSSIVISYISKNGYQLNKREFRKIVAAMIIIGGIFWTGASAVTPLYIKILYPNLYQGIGQLNMMVNAAQIFYFLTTLLLVVVLTLCDAKWQLRIQIGYSALFLVLGIFFTIRGGLAGFSIAALISNICYFAATVFVGEKFAGKERHYEKSDCFRS